MELNKQVISLPLAKHLKKLGVKQESVFYWVGSNEVFYGPQFVHIESGDCSAFTASELLAKMPGRNKYWDIEGKWTNDWWLRVNQSWAEHTRRNEDGSMINTWYADYYNDSDQRLRDTLDYQENLAESIGNLLVYIIESKLFSV